MVVDYIENWEQYSRLNQDMKEGFAFLQELTDKPAGRYERGSMYAMVQEGMTAPVEEARLETHQKYIDVQYMVSGEEVLEWKNIKEAVCETPYDAERDIAFYQGDGDRITVKPGMFYIMYPQDGHKPCIHIQRPTGYKKIVLKIRGFL